MGPQFRIYGLIAVVATIVVYVVVAWLFNSWAFYWSGIAALSVTTFGLYGWDKLNAKIWQGRARSRVPENLLHLLALLGGFIGGWLGMVVFWHKIRKPVFWIVLSVSTVIHLGLVIMLNR